MLGFLDQHTYASTFINLPDNTIPKNLSDVKSARTLSWLWLHAKIKKSIVYWYVSEVVLRFFIQVAENHWNIANFWNRNCSGKRKKAFVLSYVRRLVRAIGSRPLDPLPNPPRHPRFGLCLLLLSTPWLVSKGVGSTNAISYLVMECTWLLLVPGGVLPLAAGVFPPMGISLHGPGVTSICHNMGRF